MYIVRETSIPYTEVSRNVYEFLLYYYCPAFLYVQDGMRELPSAWIATRKIVTHNEKMFHPENCHPLKIAPRKTAALGKLPSGIMPL